MFKGKRLLRVPLFLGYIKKYNVTRHIDIITTLIFSFFINFINAYIEKSIQIKVYNLMDF